MRWIFYNILFAIGFLVFLPHYLLRMRRRGGYRRHFLERVTVYDREIRDALADDGDRIWIHAVSVGELFVAFRFMELLRKEYPDIRFVLTTTTSTGRAIAADRLQPPDVLLYFPVDFPWVMRRALRWIRPSLVLLVECECWPNLIRLCYRRNIPVAIINGRLSERSFRGYRRIGFFMRDILPKIQAFTMQTEEDAERMIRLGAPRERVMPTGHMKYELAQRDSAKEAEASAILQWVGFNKGDPLLVGGSTWPGEEKILLAVYMELCRTHPTLKLMIAPRHVERIPEVISAVTHAGLPFIRRTQFGESVQDVRLLLLDTTGELRHFYSQATVIFIGKSLTHHGGQNIIEPAAYGKPVIVGPHMENFEGIVKEFRDTNALIQVNNEAALRTALATCLDDPVCAETLGRRAAEWVGLQAGAADRTLHSLRRLIPAMNSPCRAFSSVLQ